MIMPTLTPLNDPLIDQVLDAIEADPSSWNQATWGRQSACGTVHCFAGWTAALSSDVTPVWSEMRLTPTGPSINTMVGVHVTETDEVISVQTWARDRLGFTLKEAERMFYTMTNDPHELRELIARIRAARASHAPLPPAPTFDIQIFTEFPITREAVLAVI